MTIPISKYIDITSAVVGSAQATNRELTQRIFTTNTLVPVNKALYFNSLSEVGAYFGTQTTDVEYQRAVAYFNFISKKSVTANSISYYGYSIDPAPSKIIGGVKIQTLAALQLFTTATLTLTIGSITATTATIDLSSAVSVSDAMDIIQSAIQASDVDASFSSATVIYDTTYQRVIFSSGENGYNPIEVSSTTGFIEQLAWTTSTAQFSDGTDGETLTAMLDLADSTDDNFGSFCFVETLTIDEIEEVAAWNNGKNVKYMYCVPVFSVDTITYATQLASYSGTALTVITSSTNDFAESIPAIVLATTNFSDQDGVEDYMYQQITDYTYSVDTAVVSTVYDDNRINYQGRTQTAGQLLTFYQRGNLMGGTTAPTQMNIYANEMWLKSSITANIMNLLLSVTRIPANSNGIVQLTNTIQISVNQALTNGTISVGKALTSQQRALILSIASLEEAVVQVESSGYWLNVIIVPVTVGTITEFKAEYILIYSTDEAIRSISGTDILI